MPRMLMSSITCSKAFDLGSCCPSPPAICLAIADGHCKPGQVLALHLICAAVLVQGGLRLTAGAFFGNWAATMLVTLVAQTFGLLVGATVMDAKTSQTVTAVIMLTMMLVRALLCSAAAWQCFTVQCG